MKLSKGIFSGKNIPIIGVIIIVLLVVIMLTITTFRNQGLFCFIFSSKKAGTETEKTYKTQILSVEEWRKYNDPEVKFFFGEETQKLFSSKIDALRGYGGVVYTNRDNYLSIDNGYFGKGCQPLRYKYEMTVNTSILGKDLSAAFFGRWYYQDVYKIYAVYNAESQRWESFDIALEEAKLIPGDAINSTLVNVKKGSNFQKITENGYQIANVYWESKNQNSKNDIVVLIYSKPVENEINCFDYYTIKIDNFSRTVVFENQEKKCQ